MITHNIIVSCQWINGEAMGISPKLKEKSSECGFQEKQGITKCCVIVVHWKEGAGDDKKLSSFKLHMDTVRRNAERGRHYEKKSHSPCYSTIPSVGKCVNSARKIGIAFGMLLWFTNMNTSAV